MNKVAQVWNAMTKPKIKKAEEADIVRMQLQRIFQDAMSRKDAMSEAERAYFPFRYKMQQMYLNTKDNGHILALIERRKDLTILRDWYFGKDGVANDDITDMFQKTWFDNFISHTLDALFYGYTLTHLGDIVNDGFPNLTVVKRWNVSPDRLTINSFPYNTGGVKFLEDEKFKDWYVYIDTPNEEGTSPCGWGLFWILSIYEIFLRNNLGFNGTFVELFAQPFRWGTTTKTKQTERDKFAQMLQNMGSSGWGIADPGDEIKFIESALGGTGYRSYDNLEGRLQKICSKIVLGHADAIDSTPGKLGAGNHEDNPVAIALRDKQIKDGAFIENVVNGILIPQMINLGFNIPADCLFKFKNDAEVMENALGIADLGKKIKEAGLQMTAEYFTEQTDIPVELAPTPSPFGSPVKGKPGPEQEGKVADSNITNKLKRLYNHKQV